MKCLGECFTVGEQACNQRSSMQKATMDLRELCPAREVPGLQSEGKLKLHSSIRVRR